MTRQVLAISVKWYGIRGHLTSLNVINPGNIPDEWGKKALQSFENNIPETAELMYIDGVPFLVNG